MQRFSRLMRSVTPQCGVGAQVKQGLLVLHLFTRCEEPSQTQEIVLSFSRLA